jgi:hypothetical protein
LRAESEFDAALMLQRYMEMYDEILGRPAAIEPGARAQSR